MIQEAKYSMEIAKAAEAVETTKARPHGIF
jgi:hypothetical protein